MNTNVNEISLYNIATLFREYYYNYYLISDKANYELEKMYNEDSIVIMDFDHNKKELSVIDPHSMGTVMGDNILFYKDKNNELRNKPSINGTFLSFVYAYLKEYLLNIIDEYSKYDDFAKYELNITINNYNIYINYYNMQIKTKNYEIEYNYLYDNYHFYNKKNKKEVKILRDNLDNIFKNIYLPINILPLFMQQELSKMRLEELNKGIIRKRIFLKEIFES